MKIIILFIISSFLVSCWDAEEWIVEDSIDTVDAYINTLDSSVQNAKKVTEAMNAQQAGLKENLNTK